MKKVVAFLLCVLIFVTPVTTFVKADVVIGDNDDIVVNENATILGRKLALLESFSDLALSGVTEYTISNADNVDDYLDSLWQEVNDAIDYLNSGEGFEDISNQLKSKYIYNLMNYRDYITNRGNYLSYTLQNPTTSLLETFFANNVYGKIDTTHYDLALDMFRSLSTLNSGIEVNPDLNYLSYIDRLNKREHQEKYFWWFDCVQTYHYGNYYGLNRYPAYNYSWWYTGENHNTSGFGSDSGPQHCSDILTLNINSNNGTYYFNISVNGYTDTCWVNAYNPNPSSWWNCANFRVNQGNIYAYGNGQVINSQTFSQSGTLAQVLEYCCNHFKNVNLYVDGVCWANVGGVSQPTLDIDGFIKIFGNDNPQQYELQPNTQIDYDQLYQVVYNAIRDNLPISKDDINYYDSHDTIYSPTIINNYGDEEGDESDLIDTILDYAVIPKFDTAIAQPMRLALTNGVVIMNNSITNVIPNEILFILGACFFLLLFAVVINRMIK